MKTLNPNISAPRAAQPIAQLMVLGGALALFAGCGTYPESHVVSAPPPATPTSTPTVVTTTSTPVVVAANPAPGVVVATPVATASGIIYVTQAPPPLQQEVIIARPERPSPGHAWVPGYWTWQNNRYEWMAGHWEMPPHASAKWIAPRWEQEGGGYRFYEGYWRY